MPIASFEVCVKTKVSGVAMYKPSKMPLTEAKSSVYCCAFFKSAESVGRISSSRTSLPKAKADIYSSAEATYSLMMAALDSTASVIWLVMSFLTIEAVFVDTMNQSRDIPANVIAVVRMPMRVTSFLLARNFINSPPIIKIWLPSRQSRDVSHARL